MPSAMHRSMLLVAVTLALTLTANQSYAKDAGKAAAGNVNQSPAKKKQAAKAVRSAKPPAEPGSRETVSQRNARLQRECRGAANAGACTGYTR